MATTRRLAAILAADVAGYSRLMGADEEGTHERLHAHLAELIHPRIAEHRGRVVKNTGDGLLAEFASVVDAVRCAVEMQRGMAERNTGVAANERIEFRVGVNLGDVIAEGDDIFGDGVNVAARLEGLAAPGGVCVSGTVRDHVGDRLPYGFKDIGEQSVKNIAQPVRVYALRPEATVDLPASGAQLPRAQRRRPPAVVTARLIAGLAVVVIVLAIIAWRVRLVPILLTTSTTVASPVASVSKPLVAPRLSIVVLPFTNLSDDPKQQYFADGITEDLTTDLSRISDILVISRESAFTYRDKAVNAKQIGRELDVRYVLEGSIRRSGNQVRVTAQLIDAATDVHLWAERFDRDIGNLFALQDEITTRIANALGVELIAAEAARPSEHPDAVDYILRGRAAAAKGPGREHTDEAIGFFERALAIDPQSVEAQAGLAGALAGRVRLAESGSPAADIERASRLLTQALALSPRSTLAHTAKAGLLRAQGRWDEAISEYETVLASDRNAAIALFGIGICKVQIGLANEAIQPLEQSIRLDPRDPYIVFRYDWLGLAHLLQSHTAEAIVWFAKARNISPGIPQPHANLASAYGLRGDTEHAAAELAEARRLIGGDRYSSIARLKASPVGPGYRVGPRVEALVDATFYAGLRKAGMPEE
jgi:adenylate cyclase